MNYFSFVVGQNKNLPKVIQKVKKMMYTQYLIINLLLAVFSFLMIKQWGIKILQTFISIAFVYCCIAIFNDNGKEQTIYKFIFNFGCLIPGTLLMLISLYRLNNLKILRETSFLWIVFISIIFSTILCLFNKSFIFLIVSTLFIGPIYESIFFHEIIFKMIRNKYEIKKSILFFFFLSILIAFLHGTLEIYSIISRVIGFFLLFLIRVKWNENSKFWRIVFIHFLYNLIWILIFLKLQ